MTSNKKSDNAEISRKSIITCKTVVSLRMMQQIYNSNQSKMFLIVYLVQLRTSLTCHNTCNASMLHCIYNIIAMSSIDEYTI